MTESALSPVLHALPEVPSLPTGQRWWNERVQRWTESLEHITQSSRATYAQHVSDWPRVIEKMGLGRPTNAAMVTKAIVRAYADYQGLAPTTRAMNLGLMRQFLAFEKSPLALDRLVWRAPKRVARRRFWLTRAELSCLMRAAVGPERILVALMGLNGLRRGEVLSLRVGDLRMEMPDPSLAFYGKGNKLRDIAMSRETWAELLPLVGGRNPTDRVYPWGRSRIHSDLKRACLRAGIRAYSPHDLRRTFGRLAMEAGASLSSIQAVYGHESPDLTSYYIGDDRRAMRAGIDALSKLMAETAREG